MSFDKGELLGTVATDGESRPDTEQLKTLTGDGSVIGGFCTTCGSHHEIFFKDAEEIFGSLQEPLVFEGKYIEMTSCPICNNEKKEVVIKNIP